MNPILLKCVNCGKEYNLGLYDYCTECNFPLEVIFDISKNDQLYVDRLTRGIWRFQSCSSLVSSQYRVSLGEGSTPLVTAKKLANRYNISNIYVKNEGQNPTGSFKDRPTSVGISFAISKQMDHVIISSTGNAGASLSAYAARAGVKAIVLIPKGVPQEKLTQISIHGADIIQVSGSVSDSLQLAREASKRYGWLNLTSTFLSPYSIIGNRTIAYEIYDELGMIPDWIIVPVGVGPLLVGIYKGFQELLLRGITSKMPRMVAAQAQRCSPIYRAYKNDLQEVKTWEFPFETIASGIGDPLSGYENDGTYTLRIVKQSKGMVTSSLENEILDSTELLAKSEGIFCEPSSAVAISALRYLIDNPSYDPSQSVVLILTGHGLKQQAVFQKKIELRESIAPDISYLEELLNKIEKF